MILSHDAHQSSALDGRGNVSGEFSTGARHRTPVEWWGNVDDVANLASGGTVARSKDNRPNRPERPRMSVTQARDDLQRSGQQQGSPGMLIIALLGTLAFIAFYYHGLVLEQMTQLTGGLSMLDHRITGYSLEDVTALAAVMDDDALGQLNWVHKTAGMIFPITVALAVSVVGAWSLRSVPLRWVTLASGVIFAVVDIWENIAIERALHELTADAVATASLLTQLRWVLLAVLIVWLVIMLIQRLRRRSSVD